MVSQANPRPTPRVVQIPWQFVEAEDPVAASFEEAIGSREFFLDPPEGEWEIDSPPPVAEEPIADSEIATELQDTDPGEEESDPGLPERGGWVVALLCIGLGLIAACVILPEADVNRRMAYEREKLQLDLTQIEHQVDINKQFLSKIESDPQLTLRLIQREMHAVPRGETVLDVSPADPSSSQKGSSQSQQAERMSPFFIVNLPPAPQSPPYQPTGGLLARLCRGAKSRLYLMGGSLLLVAIGLVAGESARPALDTTMLNADPEEAELDTEETDIGSGLAETADTVELRML